MSSTLCQRGVEYQGETDPGSGYSLSMKSSMIFVSSVGSLDMSKKIAKKKGLSLCYVRRQPDMTLEWEYWL